ncbi:MAG: ion transporter [Gammaproteobacteria bacterium]|nr:ion transporter [Gammaproteobacteria bacterium]
MIKKSIETFISNNNFQYFITGLIIFNGILMGLETSKSLIDSYGQMMHFLDNLIVAIFTVEIILRIYVYRLNFFKDPWSLFDFFVVTISLIPASGNLSILRVLRVLRLFRLLTIVPQMRIIIAALIGVIPGIASVSLVLILFFYVFAIMSYNLFGETYPQWFGGLGASMYTLFQIMTLESWSMGIARPVMETHPGAWLFFVIYILIVTFIMVNLFIGLIVDAIFTIKGNDKDNEKDNEDHGLTEKDQILALRNEIKELKQIILSKK